MIWETTQKLVYYYTYYHIVVEDAILLSKIILLDPNTQQNTLFCSSSNPNVDDDSVFAPLELPYFVGALLSTKYVNIVCKFKSTKSRDDFDMSTDFMKKVIVVIAPLLAHFINCCLLWGVLPDVFKTCTCL